MKTLDLFKSKLSNLPLMWLLIFLTAIWSVIIQNGNINKDGLLYLEQAYLFNNGEWKAGLLLQNWPFFSLIISFFYKITHINLQWIAHVINIFLFGIAIYYYLKILKLIYEEKNIIFYGGVLLLSCVPIMDDYVGMILRDHGFWCGSMAGTYFYFKYLNNPLLKNKLLWQLSFALAGLFRPEGFVFLFAIPIFNFFFLKTKIIKKYSFKLFIEDFIILIFSAIFLYILKTSIDSFDFFIETGKINEFVPRLLAFYNSIITPFSISSVNPNLNLLLQQYSFGISASIIGTLFLIKFLKLQGILNIYFLYTHFRNNAKLSRLYSQPLYFFISISVFLVFISFFNYFILSGRYFVVSIFWILMIASSVFLSIFENTNLKKNTLQKFLIILFIIASIVTILVDSNKINIEREAGSYLSNMQVIGKITLINSNRIAYYGGFDIEEIVNSSKDYSDNQEWILFNGRVDDYNRNILSKYNIYKGFYHGDKCVLLFKKFS